MSRRRRTGLVLLVVMSVAVLGAAMPSAAPGWGESGSGQHFRLDVHVFGSMPSPGGTIIGRVRGLKAADAVAFRARRRGRWTTLARASLVARKFTLRWRLRLPKHPGPWIMGRFEILGAQRILESVRLNLPRPPILCEPVSAPAHVPPGDGWITGGLYSGGGGPPPGFPSDCSSASYSVSAFGGTGQAVATQAVPAGHSYVFVLPAGSYVLRSEEGCGGHATVTVGRQTTADTRCLAIP